MKHNAYLKNVSGEVSGSRIKIDKSNRPKYYIPLLP
jgi:hypothetical protein